MIRYHRDGGFQPDPDAMEKARIIAGKLGLRFDPEEIESLSRELHKIYFMNICSICNLEEINHNVTFIYGDMRLINAKAATSQDGYEVHFDEQLDQWFMTICHLVYISAAYELDWPEFGRLTDFYSDGLNWIINPFLLEKNREPQREFFENYAEAWNVTHPLSRAMTIFVMCHEAAHLKLKHLEDRKHPHLQEFEADAEALKMFLNIIRSAKNSDPVYVDEKLSCAPILVMRLLEAERVKNNRIYNAQGSHPLPSARLIALTDALEPVMSPEAKAMSKGMLHGFDMLDTKIQLRKLEAESGELDPLSEDVMILVRPGFFAPASEFESLIAEIALRHGLETAIPNPEDDLPWAESTDVVQLLLTGAGAVATGIIANTFYELAKKIASRPDSKILQRKADETRIEMIDVESGLRVTIVRINFKL